ncbi:MAG TPA: hypothetical protein VMC43_00020 [Candidatus Paceibacterota bacterium]|nr:hypothetical protein [Candidatus Paceibacterota bacterium]
MDVEAAFERRLAVLGPHVSDVQDAYADTYLLLRRLTMQEHVLASDPEALVELVVGVAEAQGLVDIMLEHCPPSVRRLDVYDADHEILQITGQRVKVFRYLRTAYGNMPHDRDVSLWWSEKDIEERLAAAEETHRATCRSLELGELDFAAFERSALVSFRHNYRWPGVALWGAGQYRFVEWAIEERAAPLRLAAYTTFERRRLEDALAPPKRRSGRRPRRRSCEKIVAHLC